jgi:uncharacterized membrane protein
MPDPANPNDNWQQVPNTPSDPAASNVPPPNYPPQQPPPGYTPQAAGLSSNGAAAIAYLTFIPAVVFLVMDPYRRDPFIRFHAIQCIGLTVVAVLIGIVLGVITVPLAMTGMWAMAHLLSELVNLAFLIVWLICIIQASQGKWFKLPVVGEFALKQSQK